MLKFFVTLFLIVEGIAALDETETDISDICDKTCNSDELNNEKFPETSEDLQEICKPGIEFMECNIQKAEICRNHRIEVEALQMGYRILETAREVCSEDTLLHAAIVDNLKCFSSLVNNRSSNRECHKKESSDRIQQIIEDLNEEGLLSLTENDRPSMLHECIRVMNSLACSALVIEGECGTVAMDAFVEVILKVRPDLAFYVSCEEEFHFLPAIIRLRKEEKERNV